MFVPSFVPSSPFSVVTRVAGFFPGGKEFRGVRLTSYLNLVPILRTSVFVPQQPPPPNHNIHMYMMPINNSMKQSPSWEANSIYCARNYGHFMEPTGSLPYSKSSPPFAFLSQINHIHVPSHFVKFNFNVILPSICFPRVFPSKPCTHFSCLTYVPHALPISLLLSPKLYLVWAVQIIQLLVM